MGGILSRNPCFFNPYQICLLHKIVWIVYVRLRNNKKKKSKSEKCAVTFKFIYFSMC